MPRIAHGSVIQMDDLQQAHTDLVQAAAASPMAFAVVAPGDMNAFDFLFPTLQDDDANLLPGAPDTPAKLKALGAAMVDPLDPTPDGTTGAAPNPPGDSNVPSIYTYFGQFVDHDITLEVQPADLPPTRSASMTDLLSPTMTPLTVAEIRNIVKNFRSPTLDLDHLYGLPAPRDPANGAKLLVGHVFSLHGTAIPTLRPPGKGDDNDLPREPRGADILHDRAAMIGDPRNDENLIVAQLHLAFIKAHNALVDQGHNFEEARTILRQHYQYIILHDFLKRVADPAIVDDVLQNGNHWFDGLADPFFTPLEFSVASYRFGHTMARDDYDFNLNFRHDSGVQPGAANLNLLFTFTALSGSLGPGVGQAAGTDTLPDNWIIQWENFVDTGDGRPINMARRFDPKLAGKPSSAPAVDDGQGLFRLHALDGSAEQRPEAARLAVRNLLRGYRLRLPTGQATAKLLGLPVMTAAQVEAAASSPDQVAALQAGGFSDRTPLWYYVLAEASALGGGNHLGPVGSTIVTEVLAGMIRRTEGSILRQPGWQPSLPSAVPGEFQLGDLLRFAGVLAGGVAPRTYVVQAGDTLSSIAQTQLGDVGRWPEIFLLNRGIIRNPDLIFPGQVLTLPTGAAVQPEPRIYVVKPGDTLSAIAQAQLGNGSRWPEIFALNRGVISNPDAIFPNQVLVLPN